jgi:hypothetical protein
MELETRISRGARAKEILESDIYTVAATTQVAATN